MHIHNICLSVCQREKKRVLFLYNLQIQKRISSTDRKRIISWSQRSRTVSVWPNPAPTLTPSVSGGVRHNTCHSEPVSLKWEWVIKPSTLSLQTTVLSGAAPLCVQGGGNATSRALISKVMSCRTLIRQFLCTHDGIDGKLEVTLFFWSLNIKNPNISYSQWFTKTQCNEKDKTMTLTKAQNVSQTYKKINQPNTSKLKINYSTKLIHDLLIIKVIPELNI